MGRCGFTSIRRAFVPAVAGWSLVLGALAAGIRASPPIPASAAPVSSLSVQGNDLVDGGGTVVQLHGVNRVGALYPCIQGWGIFDGPSDSASAAAIAGWHTNAVRLQLNEDCWLGINGVNGADAGSNYQGAIVSYVNLLHQAGLYVILSLTWSAPGQSLSSNQPMMADADHAPNFWQSVATTFKADPAVIFDLYSAPHGISWDCWRNGCTTSGGWQAAGMQTLANAVRGTGATQPLLLSGLNWANDLSGWLPSKPSDPANALVAGFHESNGSGCNAPSCWSGSLFNVAQTVPVVTSELSENDCAHSFIDGFMGWADMAGVSYLGSSWEAWASACSGGPTLITAYDGTPTNYGIGLRDHLAGLGRGPSLSVAGNHLVDGSGKPIVLHGVNRSSTVYPCIQGWGLFDGPSDNASAAAIASWHTNAARLQLNEDCWLGINGVNPAYGGANYQAAIGNYVNLLQQNGLYVILSLAWNAPGTTASNGQQVMADADHAPAFWRSVATAFRYDPGVVFDLYNEPHDISWDCWLNGCTTSGGWQAAGMQTLVNAVRMAGATQPLLLSGVGWGNDLTQWLASRPNDPANALVASFHEYDITACVTLSCWTSTVLPVAQVVPVVTAELGESDCTHAFIDPYMAWADLSGVSYLGLTWEAWANGCNRGPTLITAYDGTPTNFGVGLHDHLATLSKGLSLSVTGNRLLDGNGKVVVLHGASRVGALYACVQGWGMFDGPTDSNSVAAIASWHANAVRLDLNEDCWLGINGVSPAYGGSSYQNAIASYVNLLHQGGLYVILSLTWNAPGTTLSTDQLAMADADHALAFWQSVATTFKTDRAVLFDLYSEPHDVSWDCWLNGCTTAGGWQAAGMQSLVNAVRGAGATQPLLLGGLNWANDLGSFVPNKPNDPANALIASLHVASGSGCNTNSCWTTAVVPVAQLVPVVAGKLTENDCAHSFIDGFMGWADPVGIGYLGSSWEAWANACAGGPTLITSYDGTPTGYGIGLRDHLGALASGS